MADIPTIRYCLCGRDMRSPHCPRCGYATIRALSSRRHDVTMPNGTLRVVSVYNCRKCDLYFDDLDRELRCAAPPQRIGRKSKDERDKKIDDILVPAAINRLEEKAPVVNEQDLQNYSSTVSKKEGQRRMMELLKRLHGEEIE